MAERVLAFALLLLATGMTQLLSMGSEVAASEDGGRRHLGSDHWKKEQEADRVVLPEQPAVTFAQYAGMVTVDAMAGREFFYFFVEATKHASLKPLTLWLNGGPGCSSLAYGFAREFGPYRILPDASGVYLDKHAWNRESNMLFVESPSGVGFSFSKNMSQNLVGGDRTTAEDNHSFLLNWFERFPQYKGRDFYLAGESYAGHYVPQLAKLILDRNPGAKLNINLKGILIGNPSTDLYWDNVGSVDYWHSHAMISDETWEGMRTACNFSDPNCCSRACNDFSDVAWNNEIGGIDPYSIYTKVCEETTGISRAYNSLSTRRAIRPNNPFMRVSRGFDPCGGVYSLAYFNRPDVQKAIHANVSGEIPYEWSGCSPRLEWSDWQFSIIPVYKALIKTGLKIWIFSGDSDAIVPVTATRYALAAMKLRIKTPWQAWYHHQQVGGRALEYEGMTFVTIRAAGHEVLLLQPSPALHVFQSFLATESLPNLPYE